MLTTKKVLRDCVNNDNAIAMGRNDKLVYDLNVVDGDYVVGVFRWSYPFNAYVLYDNCYRPVAPRNQITPFFVKDIDNEFEVTRVLESSITSWSLPNSKDEVLRRREAELHEEEKNLAVECSNELMRQVALQLFNQKVDIVDMGEHVDDIVDLIRNFKSGLEI